MTTGSLKGRSLRLVGRADPRGEVEYNFVLGESHAGNIGARSDPSLGQLGALQRHPPATLASLP